MSNLVYSAFMTRKNVIESNLSVVGARIGENVASILPLLTLANVKEVLVEQQMITLVYSASMTRKSVIKSNLSAVGVRLTKTIVPIP